MRIISGTLKGRRLDPVRVKSARPTTDFAREGLFNVLRHRIEFEGLKVLDLFAGTGAVALEFISRGAAEVTCVERDTEAVKFMAATARSWELNNLTVVKTDVLRYLKSHGGKYDLVFADPPYDLDVFVELHERIIGGQMLTTDGLFIFEHDGRRKFEEFAGFDVQRHFGQVNFSFFTSS